MTSRTLHLVSHTHWDREWYLPYQRFRLRLVALMDKLLHLLQSDPDYRHFMLDGQTIILEDYLAVRPEKEQDIRRLVQAGRLLIGPWYILADEFLVSPEALVRNLLLGKQVARRFGPPMEVGYTPDPFGHIGQLPQVLRSFGLESAALWRGLGDEPAELWWEAPDGSRLLLCYLRDGYGNAARLPVENPAAFAGMISHARDSLAPHATTPHLLLLNGTDHHEPQPGLSQAVAGVAGRLGGDRLIHSTLPAYVDGVRATGHDFPIVRGELRQGKRSPLLPGVLSTRMWIKQRNETCQTLLERWAEPFSCWAEYVDRRSPTPLLTGHQPADRLQRPAGVLRLAWRRLLENHPHDSICGCSVDQVHEEMAVRFDEVEQVGEEITRQSLEALAMAVDTSSLLDPPSGPKRGRERSEGCRFIVVFNPTAGPRTDLVEASVESPAGLEETTFHLRDMQGQVTPYELVSREDRTFADAEVTATELQLMLVDAADGRVMGMAVEAVRVERQEGAARIEVVLGEQGEPDPQAIAEGVAQVQALLADPGVTRYHLLARLAPRLRVRFVARDVPGYGYKVWKLEAGGAAPVGPGEEAEKRARIENEFFIVEANPADGTLTITDRQTGAVYEGLNRFVDGGDRGDEYNFCRPEEDRLITAPAGPPTIEREVGPVRQTLEIALLYRLPAALSPDRRSRSDETVDVPIRTRVSLSPGVRRVDIHTVVDNRARDHRLRVRFPAPLVTTKAQYDGHYDVVTRPLGLPEEDTSGWVEQPVAEQPQRHFVDVSDGRIGLLVANRGLPEVAVIPEDGRTIIALTLLRCVGWLSRDDLHCRRGHAGPALPTPGAQCLGTHRFDYALIPHAGDWREAFAEGHAFAAPMRAVGTGQHKGPLPPEISMVSVEPGKFVISAIKQAEDGAGWIVRGYSLAEDVINVRLRPWRPFPGAIRVRMDEEPQEELEVARDGSVALAVRPREIVTVRFINASP